jgi:hypothetical protein
MLPDNEVNRKFGIPDLQLRLQSRSVILRDDCFIVASAGIGSPQARILRVCGEAVVTQAPEQTAAKWKPRSEEFLADSYYFLCGNLFPYQNLEFCTVHSFLSYDIKTFLRISFSLEMMTVLGQQYQPV